MTVDPFQASDEFNRVVELTAEAEAGGRRFYVQQRVLAGVYADPVARKAIDHNLRAALLQKILEHWTPVIRVRQ